MQETLPEIWLWNEIRFGNDRALHRLYMEQYDHLFRYGLHISSNRDLSIDCINETFTEIWQKRKKLPEVENVRGYLFIIFKRKLFRQLKLAQEKKTLKIEDPDQISYERSYEMMLIASQTEEEKKERVRQALHLLTPQQMEIIRLRYFENLSIKEISKKKSVTPRTIYNTLYAAIKTLRKNFLKKK